jgi:hypothetical protein
MPDWMNWFPKGSHDAEFLSQASELGRENSGKSLINRAGGISLRRPLVSRSGSLAQSMQNQLAPRGSDNQHPIAPPIIFAKIKIDLKSQPIKNITTLTS